MTIPATGRVLGLDWGTSRIGVAISDETQLIASPLDTLMRRTGRRLPLESPLFRPEGNFTYYVKLPSGAFLGQRGSSVASTRWNRLRRTGADGVKPRVGVNAFHPRNSRGAAPNSPLNGTVRCRNKVSPQEKGFCHDGR